MDLVTGDWWPRAADRARVTAVLAPLRRRSWAALAAAASVVQGVSFVESPSTAALSHPVTSVVVRPSVLYWRHPVFAFFAWSGELAPSSLWNSSSPPPPPPLHIPLVLVPPNNPSWKQYSYCNEANCNYWMHLFSCCWARRLSGMPRRLPTFHTIKVSCPNTRRIRHCVGDTRKSVAYQESCFEPYWNSAQWLQCRYRAFHRPWATPHGRSTLKYRMAVRPEALASGIYGRHGTGSYWVLTSMSH